MASALTHPAVPLALFAALGDGVVSKPLAMLGVAGSILPDIDVLMLRAGIPYGSMFGHRSITHSVLFALLTALFASRYATALRSRRWLAFAFLFVSIASHGVLDAMTDGGLGVAFFSPAFNRRYFLPWRMIRVSPLGVSQFFSAWGAAVLVSELQYVWLPCIGLAIAGVSIRKSVGQLAHPGAQRCG